MKFASIDALGPTELHPRLTLLRAATPEQIRQLVGLLKAMADGSPFGPSGLIEVNGVRLALDDDTISRLFLDSGLEWTIDFAAHQRRHQVTPSTGQTPEPVDVGVDELLRLREKLRSTAAERTALAADMDEVRTRLDSFANAALEVCVGQIDALEAQRNALRANVENHKSVINGRLAELEATRRDHLVEIEAVRSLDLTQVVSLRDRLVHELADHSGPDPQALELALRIDAAMRRVRDLRGRSAALSLRRREAEQRLAESVAEVTAAERASRHRTADPTVVARLEQVRDELFAADERTSRLSVNRNRRRMAALRDEESRLLAELGFDTYSSYVMGIPSERTEQVPPSEVDYARARVDEIQGELDSMEEPSDALVASGEAELRDLVATAALILGRGSVAGDLPVDLAGTGAADEVARLIEQLRSTQLDSGADDSAAVLAAANDLRSGVNAIAGRRFADPSGERPPRIAGSSISLAAWSGPPSALVAGVSAWLERLGDTTAWCNAALESVEVLEAQIRDLGGTDTTPTEIGEWARVEAELDSLLDRMVGAQERVRRNEDALVELASMRETELGIRARERDLLARIAELESGIPMPPAPAESAPEMALRDPEWDLIRFAARRRSVSFAGSLPMVIFNLSSLTSAAVEREAVFRRIQRLSDVIQILVLDDSPWVAERVSRMGMEARVIER